MASKRKSTVPCMVSTKSKTHREEVTVGCFPELLPTIPEDGILSISGGNDEEAQRTSKHADSSSSCEMVTHSCSPCCFETTDLNLFLSHMDTCHTDFHTQPLFYCLNCKDTLANVEGLALHNAKAHPQLNTEVNSAKSSLQVTKQDGVIRVEQLLFTEKECISESGISITKMPVMKMMVKGEQKDINVPRMVEIQRTDFSNKLTVVGNGTAGGLEQPGTAQVVTSTVPLPVLKTSNTYRLPPQNNIKPFWNFTPFPGSNNNLPKVMIPLSSIPTYDPAMDLNSFLKVSFGKFPYPTKAELCYLTVVSGFPEEQIKLWFAAQRLKQGISWSPEETEDTRRKMFSTVFQVTPRMLQKKSQHQLFQHCVPAQSLSARSGYVPYIPKNNGMEWNGGTVVHNPQGSFRHGTIMEQTENGFSSQKTGNNLVKRWIHKHGEKRELCSSSKTSAVQQSSSQGGQHSSHGEGSILNLTNIGSSVDCNVNTKNSTSIPSSSSAFQCRDVKANTKEMITTSNKSIVSKSTSLPKTCTKDVGSIYDYTSKERSTTTGEFFPVLTENLSAPTNLLHTLFSMSKSPKDLQDLKKGIVLSPVPEQTKLIVGRNRVASENHNSADSPSTMEQLLGNVPSTSLCSVDALLQEDTGPASNEAMQTQLGKLSTKSLEVLGVPQVLFSDLPLATSIRYKNHDAPCLKQSSSAV